MKVNGIEKRVPVLTSIKAKLGINIIPMYDLRKMEIRRMFAGLHLPMMKDLD